MEKSSRKLMAVLGIFFVVGSLQTLWADTISIPNGSFEDPYLEMEEPFAAASISDWQKAPVPQWWLGMGYTEQDWLNSGGVFVNVPFAPIDNVDGRQAAFLFSPPGYELFQDLAAVFEIGQSYTLTVGIEGGGYGMKLGVPMEIRLYYRDDTGNRITVGATEVINTNDSGVMSHFTDYQLDIPTVLAGDAWAGENIGVQLISTVGFEDAGGFWNIDHVRLTSVSEAVTLNLLFPNGGEMLLADGSCAITWQSSGPLDKVKIEYSSNAGENWSTLDPNAANEGQWLWQPLPDIDSSQCRIRISDPLNPATSDLSNDNFTIFQCQARLTADLNGDCFVDLADLVLFAGQWLDCGNPYDPDWCD